MIFVIEVFYCNKNFIRKENSFTMDNYSIDRKNFLYREYKKGNTDIL